MKQTLREPGARTRAAHAQVETRVVKRDRRGGGALQGDRGADAGQVNSRPVMLVHCPGCGLQRTRERAR